MPSFVVSELYSKISNSYSIGEIQGSGNFIGGIIGKAYSRSGDIIEISNCISFTNVSGSKSNSVGSLVGCLLAKDGVTFDALSIKNCKVLQNEMNPIGGIYKSDTQQVDYDISTMLAGIEEILLKNISTNLQVGTKSDSNSQIDFNTNFEYALGRIVRNGIHTDEALNLITDFLNTMSDKQTQLGAAQNRLESAMDEIITQHDNLVSARSTLRDADIAEFSSQYIQQQILQEASATLMSTANQSPAIALQLI